ncbi:hypothetical protein [Desulfotruncus alcoholivorax]|uniref:hypothetical protein n=1 Tax=Desulfotruncus alcoholivorax TaxID=265477 RepID=UPI0003FEC2EC|nr:hypothetical protein [Desulfotruncus alcoholivorax]
MHYADFQARIKKIEIVNKVLADGWAQSIRVSLEDIELTNENLLELRQFRPNEQVKVVIEPVQPTLFDVTALQTRNINRPGTAPNQELALDDAGEDEKFLNFTEEDHDEPLPGKVVREFKV